MLETILAIASGALALWFGHGWAKSSWRCRQLEGELSERRRASAKQQEAVAQAALKVKDELAQRPPIDTTKRSDFE